VLISEVDLRETVEEVFSLVGQHFRNESIDLILEIPERFKILGDSSRLEQVFLNLLMNSLHAIQQAKTEGKISSHSVAIRAHREGARTTILVEDTGCGIPAENIRKLFKPFFTTKDVGQGTGLGLAIVSQLLSEMGARISAASRPGEGATFSIEFAE
jgi:signal transduction histidine kinase